MEIQNTFLNVKYFHVPFQIYLIAAGDRFLLIGCCRGVTG